MAEKERIKMFDPGFKIVNVAAWDFPFTNRIVADTSSLGFLARLTPGKRLIASMLSQSASLTS